MNELSRTAPAFVEMAHRIVWCSVATVDRLGRPHSRVLHPIWVWDGASLVGWVATTPSPKRAHLAQTPYASCNYWAPSQETCVAECRAEWISDDEESRTMVWDLFKESPEPLGYDPATIGMPGWNSPTSPGFAVVRLSPWRLRVAVLVGGAAGESPWQVLTWQE